MIVLQILAAIAALGILIIVHESGHYFAAKWSGMRVDRFSVGFGPQIASFKRGETIFQIALIPLGGFVQIAGLNPGDDTIAEDDPRAYQNRPAISRLFTIFAGPATNYVFAAIAMTTAFLVWGVPAGAPMIDQALANSPAAAAGLQSGDDILSINGKLMKSVGDVQKAVSNSEGKTLQIAIMRKGSSLTIPVTPALDNGTYRMGAQLGAREARDNASVGESIKQGVMFPINYSAFVLANLPKLFSPKSTERASGPVGIITVMKDQIGKGWREGVEIVAIISVALGLFNLLPFPALDGGRIVFLGWELITRRRFNQKAEATIHLVGLGVLLSFTLYVTVVNDIYRKHFGTPATPPDTPQTTQPAK